MRIASSTLSMTGQHTHIENFTKDEQLQFWVAPSSTQPSANNPQDILDLSSAAEAMLTDSNISTAKTVKETTIDFELSEEDRRKIDLIQKFIEVLTGKKIKFVIPEKVRVDDENKPLLRITSFSPHSINANINQGWGLHYELHEVYREAETMSFSATGSIRTADGKVIDLNLTLNLQREMISERHIQFLAGTAKIDPLVINFDAASAGLTNDKFAFDLDADGKQDAISFVKPGSGFLALDKNSDGVINDGRELFGPQSGDGFADLALYDLDNNGWIDENDPIYDQLRIWTKDTTGNDTLLTLGQTGIGAIYLGHISTEFALKSQTNNSLQGQIRQTGLFLRENGMAGTIQHVDLAV